MPHSLGPPVPAPLAAHPLFRGHDRASLGEALERSYRVRDLAIGVAESPFHAEANRVQLENVQLHYCRYDLPVEIVFPDMTGFREVICLSGAGSISLGGERIEIDPNATGLVPPAAKFRGSYGFGYQHLVVQFDEVALLRKHEVFVGRSSPTRSLDLGLSARAAETTIATRSIAAALSQILTRDAGTARTSVVELEQALVVAFLEQYLPETGNAPSREPSRTVSMLLQDYIEANWNKPLTLEDVSAATGVSVRRMFTAFKRDLGVNPAAYIREVRLNRAHQMLASANAEMSVMDVAMRCQFSSMGHFARRYRDKFGELPSATISRSLRRGRS